MRIHASLLCGILALVISQEEVFGEVLVNPAITGSAAPFSGSFPASNVFDSTLTGEYASATLGVNTFIDFDFGTTRVIDSFAFVNRTTQNVDRISSFNLVFSQDAIFGNGDDIVRSFANPVTAAGEPAGPLYNFAATSARYVQWDVTAAGGSSQNLGAVEMRFANGSQGDRINATVIGSAPPFNANFLANNSVDGNVGESSGTLNASYASAGQSINTFVDFDLGSLLPVSGFDLYQRLPPVDQVTTFDLIFSRNSTFTDIVATRSYTATGDGDNWTETDSFSPFLARFVRFDVTSGGGANPGISEIVFFSLPEPTSIALWSLLGLGLAGFGYHRFRQKN